MLLLNRKFLPFLSVAVATSIATVAHAAVNFDSTTGTGFVGKGDVQEALGFNNAQLQAQAGSLSFTYQDQAEYELTCSKETRKQTVRNTFQRKQTISSTVAYDPRVRNQITGFKLTGFGTPTMEGKLECPEGFSQEGEPRLVTTSGGVLSVNDVVLPQS
jgi:hypothetical protein